MTSSGYSGTPLWKKLGIKSTHKLWLIHVPDDYNTWFDFPIKDQECERNIIPDLVHLFVKSTLELDQEMKKLQKVYLKHPTITIWVSWYKKASGIATDVTEDVIRNYALNNGLVDVKVCAVNEIWSGLKLIVPIAKR